jgi:hypothetical protein
MKPKELRSMPKLSGFASLAALPLERVTDKITGVAREQA